MSSNADITLAVQTFLCPLLDGLVHYPRICLSPQVLGEHLALPVFVICIEVTVRVVSVLVIVKGVNFLFADKG